VVLALVAIATFTRFVVDDGGSVIFTVLMAWFAALAVEPAVAPLSRRMKRGAATWLVMAGLALFLLVFVLAFGQLFVDQVHQLAAQIPSLLQTLFANVAAATGGKLDPNTFLTSLDVQPAGLASAAAALFSGFLTVLGKVLDSVLGLFTFGLLFFYLSADGPRLRLWLARMFPAAAQQFFLTVYDLTAVKTGHYVGARVVLATINASTTAVVFVLIGMPNWLALSIWTGLVAQFVPTIGTYISIILPVLVGLLSGQPWIGVAALIWALIYQQVENLTIEPKISARAVNVHPAVAFASVMMGAALFGAAGALLAIPVTAMVLSLLDSYREPSSARVPGLPRRSSHSAHRTATRRALGRRHHSGPGLWIRLGHVAPTPAGADHRRAPLATVKVDRVPDQRRAALSARVAYRGLRARSVTSITWLTDVGRDPLNGLSAVYMLLEKLNERSPAQRS